MSSKVRQRTLRIISVVHELFHVKRLIYSHADNVLQRTPPKFTPGKSENYVAVGKQLGPESGDFFEFSVFGTPIIDHTLTDKIAVEILN